MKSRRRNKFNYLPILIIILTIFVLISLALKALGFKKSVNYSSSNKMQQNKADWKTYKNKTYHYSIKYPPDMYIDSSLSGDRGTRFKYKVKNERRFPANTPGGFFVVEPIISIDYFWQVGREETIDSVISQPNVTYAGKPMIYQKRKMDGKTVYRFEYLKSNSPQNYISTLFEVNRKVFRLSASSYEITPELRVRYNQILSTFKFLD